MAVPVTLGMTLLMMLTFRKPRRVTVVSPFISMLISAITLPVFMLLSGARLNIALAIPIMALGLLVGFIRGQTKRLYHQNGQVMGQHSLFFLAGWGASLALGILLSSFGSALLASIGLLPLFLNTGTQVGINANIFLRRLFMAPSGVSSSINVAPPGRPERHVAGLRPPERISGRVEANSDQSAKG
jgi:hypothetical protein